MKPKPSAYSITDALILRPLQPAAEEPDIRIQSVIKAKHTRSSGTVVCVTHAHAGPGTDDTDHPPPTVVLEKTPDQRIRKITVSCPCGSHAELVVEYDEEEPGRNSA